MGKCKQCGTELSDGVLFCKKCGVAVVKERVVCVDDFKKLSLEMRTICDKMTEVFVSEMKKIEIIKVDMQNTIDMRDKEIINLKKQLVTIEAELEKTKKECASFELELNLLREQQVITRISDHELDIVKMLTCHECGEEITEDMMFCGNCGTRLK